MGTVSNFYSDPNLASIPILISSRTINPGIDFTNLMRPFKHPKPYLYSLVYSGAFVLPSRPRSRKIATESCLSKTSRTISTSRRIVAASSHATQTDSQVSLSADDANSIATLPSDELIASHRISQSCSVTRLPGLLCPSPAEPKLLLASPVRARTNHSCPINPANEVQPI